MAVEINGRRYPKTPKEVMETLTPQQKTAIYHIIGTIADDPMLTDSVLQLQTLNAEQRNLFEVLLRWSLMKSEQ